MTLRVQDQSPEVQAMAQHWPIVDALLGGTAAMRAAKREFMPQWPAEENAAYDVRISTATLFPAFRRTLDVMAGKPFSRSLTLGKDVPKDIVEWSGNIDLDGRSLHAFASELLREALSFGIAGILVGHQPNNGAVTKADYKKAGLRPFMTHVQHQNILGWQAAHVNGVQRLTQIRLAEVEKQADGSYGTKLVRRVRVLEPGRWELWEEQKDGKYALIDHGTVTFNGIPFVPVYGVRKGFMHGESPLLDLAYLNVKHWQSQSDQDNILRVARVPILAMIGAEEDSTLRVGASSAVKLPQGAALQYVEHSGAAIGAGQSALEKLEEQMIQTGAELLVQRPGQRTATESSNDAEASRSELLRIVENFEDSLDLALQYMAEWQGGDDGGHVSLFKDFGAATLSDASAQLILSMQQGGLLSKATALKEQQRRGIVDAGIDPELELAEVEAEGPKLGEMNSGGESVDYDDEEQYGGYTATHTSLGIKVSR